MIKTMSIQPNSAELDTPILKYAKSMMGRIYSYPVHTVGEFKQCIFQTYRIPLPYLRLLEPEEIQQIDEHGEPTRTVTMYDDELLLSDVVYYILVDTIPAQTLLEWIQPSDINPYLRIENPAYHITPEEADRLLPEDIDYLAIHPERIEVISKNYHRLTQKGWRRLFVNPAAGPLLEQIYDEIQTQLCEYASFIAMNTETIPIVIRLLRDGAPIRYLDHFWRNLTENENALTFLREHHPERMNPFILSKNPTAVPYFMEQIELHGEDYALHLDWRVLSSTVEYEPLLARFPHLIDPIAIQRNTHPSVIQWIRIHLKPDEMNWDVIASHTDSAFIDLLEEHLGYLTTGAWNTLCCNPSAVHLLKRHPERIHWTLLCCNPSAEVVPLIENYLIPFMDCCSVDIATNHILAYPILHRNRVNDEEGEGEGEVEVEGENEEISVWNILSDEGASLIGTTFIRHHIHEQWRQKDICDEIYRTILNRGAISLHPHTLPLLKKYPALIYPNAFSLRNDIYVTVVPPTLD